MTLIICPDCSSEVSDIAVSCPKCGRPISIPSVSNTAESHLTTIEKTSKNLKLADLVSRLIIYISVILLLFYPKDSLIFMNASIIFFIGIVAYLINKIRIWWHHK
jgi:uncharacterized membrane protein YvbJ